MRCSARQRAFTCRHPPRSTKCEETTTDTVAPGRISFKALQMKEQVQSHVRLQNMDKSAKIEPEASYSDF